MCIISKNLKILRFILIYTYIIGWVAQNHLSMYCWYETCLLKIYHLYAYYSKYHRYTFLYHKIFRSVIFIHIFAPREMDTKWMRILRNHRNRRLVRSFVIVSHLMLLTGSETYIITLRRENKKKKTSSIKVWNKQ